MSKVPTIPCPICGAPIHVRQVQLPSGEIARVFAEPLSISDNWVDFHEHQSGDSRMSSIN